MNQRLPILLYHSVTDSPAPGLERFTVSPARFAEHLDFLLDDDRSVLALAEAASAIGSGAPLPEGAVVVTVDDGLADFADHAWPELRARGMTATLYAVAGYLDGRSRWLPGAAGDTAMLGARDLQDLADDGVDIGSHTMSHPQLDLVPLSRARREIVESKDVLEQLLGRPVGTFAYPHGHHTRAIRDLVVEAGYSSASAVRNMVSHDRDDVFALARLTITDRVTVGRLGRLVEGRGVRRAPRRELLRTKAGRQARRLRSVRPGRRSS